MSVSPYADGPDLTAGVEAVTRLMDDVVVITTLDPAESWVLNKTTLRLEQPSATTLYDGRCKIKPLGNAQQGVTEEGGLYYGLDAYRLDIPLDSPRIPEGAVALITASRRFPAAVGTLLDIKRLTTKTLVVQASYAAVRRETLLTPAAEPTVLFPSPGTFPGAQTYPLGA